MKRLLQNMKIVLPVLLLALSGLAVGATAAPDAHAAPQPSLYVIGQGGGVYVSGSGFTPGVQVRLEVLNSTLTAVESIQYLTPQPCALSGGCFATLMTTGYTGSAAIVADQTGQSSTWAQAVIHPAPYITAYTQTGGSTVGISVSGSGYNAGATVKISVFQFCGRFCLQTLATESVTASIATARDANSGLIYGGLVVPAHSGWVFVQTSGGATNTSNLVSLYIP